MTWMIILRVLEVLETYRISLCLGNDHEQRSKYNTSQKRFLTEEDALTFIESYVP